MYTTLREIAGAVQIQLKQLGDDRQIPFTLMVKWCSLFINKYRYEKNKSEDSGNYLSIYSDIPILTATANSNPNIVAGRKYIELPTSIYDYHKDAGVNYLSYSDFSVSCMPSFAGVRFTRTTPAKSQRIYMSDYEKPTPSNPYFYRVGNYLPLLGIELINVTSLEIGLITSYDPFTTGSLDEELDMGEEGMDYIVKNVLDLGRFMLQVPSDRTNDADEETEGKAPTQKLVSVNQQPIQSEE